MDPATHAFAAAIAAEAFGPGAGEPWALLAATGASVLPDIDFLARSLGGFALLRFHGTVTHSIVGAAILALAWAGLLAVLSESPFPILASFALMGAASHLLLDLAVHQKGITLLWPFSSKARSAGLLLGLNPLASPRCGEGSLQVCIRCQVRIASASPVFRISMATVIAGLAAFPHRRTIAIAGLVALALFGLLQGLLKTRARRLARRTLGIDSVVFPASYGGWRWLAAAPWTPGWATADVDVRHGTVGTPRVHLPAPRELVGKASHLAGVPLLKEKSVVPFAEPAPEGTGLWWRDLSFDLDPDVPLGILQIDFDENGGVRREEYRERW